MGYLTFSIWCAADLSMHLLFCYCAEKWKLTLLLSYCRKVYLVIGFMGPVISHTQLTSHTSLISHLVTHLVRPHQQEYPPGGPGLSGLIHEKAHPCVSQLLQSPLKCIDAGRINCFLVQQVPSGHNPIWKKCSRLSRVHLSLTDLKEWPRVPFRLLSK